MLSAYEGELEKAENRFRELERQEPTLQLYHSSLESMIRTEKAEQDRDQEQLDNANKAISSNTGVQPTTESAINNTQDLARGL
jgi:chromosome segregation ATPase